MEKKLVVIIKTYQDFIRTADEKTVLHNRERLNALFNAISDSYIPILNMLGRFEAEKSDCKLGLVLPPVLCSMLENPNVQELYKSFLDKRIALGKKELNRCKEEPKALEIIAATIEKYGDDVERALKYASVNAGSVVEYYGAQEGFITFDEIEKRLSEHPEFKAEKIACD